MKSNRDDAINRLGINPSQGIDSDASGYTILANTLLKQLFKQGTSAVLAMPLCAILLLYGLKDNLDITTLLVWLTAILVLTLCRSLLIYLFSVSGEWEHNHFLWRNAYIAIELCSGLIWGSTGYFLAQLDIIHQMFVFFAFGGMLMGATIILAPMLITYIAYALPSSLFFVFWLSLQDNPIYTNMVILTLLFCAVMIYITYLMQKRIVESIALAFNNDNLVIEAQRTNSHLQKKIQEKVIVEKKLIASKKEYARIIENMQDTYYRTDIDGRIVSCSPSVKTLLGYEVDELIGTKLANLYALPAKRDELLQLLQQNNGKLNNFEAQLLSKDEHIIWVSTNAQFYYDNQNNILGVEGTTRNITQSKASAEAIFQAKEEFRHLYEFNNKILENNPAGIMTLDNKNRITFMNPALINIIGGSQEEKHPTIGVDIMTISSIKKANLSRVVDAIREKRAVSVQTNFVSLYGKESSLEIKGIPIINRDTYNGAIFFVTDITDIKTKHHNMEFAKKSAEYDRKSLQSFFEKVSTELKNPLNNIMGTADLLLNQTSDESIGHIEDISLILDSSKAIADYLQAIDNIVSSSSQDTSQAFKATNVKQLSDKINGVLRNKFKKRGFEFEVSSDDNIPDNIGIDQNWLLNIVTIVLYDFISQGNNAKIRVDFKMEKDSELDIEIFHSDYHVPNNYFDFSVVEPTADQSRTYNVNIATSKQLVESLSGSVFLEHPNSHASIVHITIPIQPFLLSEIQNKQTISTNVMENHLNVLIVEDLAPNQQVLQRMLLRFGHQCVIANDGKEALEKIGQFPAFDVILMDINMPNMDGLETTRRIRQMDDQTKANVPIIAVTATSHSNKQQWFEAGISDYLLKPIDMGRVKTVLDHIKT